MNAVRLILCEVLPHPDLPHVVKESIQWGAAIVLVSAIMLGLYLALVGPK